MNEVRQKQIEKMALDTLKEVGYPKDASSVDVILVAKKLGIVVSNISVKNDEMDGFIIIDEESKNVLGTNSSMLIGVNSNRSFEWKRFIIAHEIGHYIMDYRDNDSTGLFAHRDHRDHDEKENDIDFFAANLLMPRDIFVKMYDGFKKFYDRDELVEFLANTFQVTEKMTRRRINELGLLNE